MTETSQRLQQMFAATKMVCFGRFIVDIPESAELVWGDPLVPLDVTIYPRGIDKVNELAQEFAKALQAEKAINHDDVPLLLSVGEIKTPPGKIVAGYDGFDAINGLQIRGYFSFGQDGVVIKARPLRSDAEDAVELISSIAQRLRHRTEKEIPAEPGNCIEGAFLPDPENPSEDHLSEHIRVGFRLKEFPDTHFSFYVAPSNPHNPDGDSLERQFKRIKEDPATPEEKRMLAKIKYFRESRRRIHEWDTGYEVLMRLPDEEGSRSHHEFQMKFIGVAHDPYKPYADLQMQTGVLDNAAGATNPGLTDDEAIAVWDKITSTIRVRATSGSVSSDAASAQQLPLGELAATGRVCPQSGWWQASEANVVGPAGGRRFFSAGERMSHVTLAATQSLWQKLKGEPATYLAATMWRLVEYGGARPRIAVAVPSRGDSDDRNRTAESDGPLGEEGPPPHQG